MSESVPGIPHDPLNRPVLGSLPRRRALVKGVSREASPVTTHHSIQIRAHPPAETKESNRLVNRVKELVRLIVIIYPSNKCQCEKNENCFLLSCVLKVCLVKHGQMVVC